MCGDSRGKKYVLSQLYIQEVTKSEHFSEYTVYYINSDSDQN